MTEPGIHIHHFSVMAPHDVIEETMAFYRDLLDIKPGYRPHFSLPGYWLYSGEQPIIHLVANEERPQGSPGYFHHIALRCADIDETISRLSAAGIEYREKDLNDVGQTQITVIDPAGNLVELNFEQRRTSE